MAPASNAAVTEASPKPKLTLPPAPKLQPSVKKQKTSPQGSGNVNGGLKQHGSATASEQEPPPGKLPAPEALPTATFGKKAPIAATDRSSEVHFSDNLRRISIHIPFDCSSSLHIPFSIYVTTESCKFGSLTD